MSTAAWFGDRVTPGGRRVVAAAVGSTGAVAPLARVVVVGPAVAGLVEVTGRGCGAGWCGLFVAPAVAGLVTSGGAGHRTDPAFGWPWSHWIPWLAYWS
jgi:hypothetical protein